MGKRKKVFKLKKKEQQFLIYAFVFCVIASLITILILRNIYTGKSVQDISSTVSGILGTFLSFFGSILVFMALKSQIKANKLVQNQFRQQSDEQLFFRLTDALHNRIINYSFDIEDGKNLKKIASYDILIFIMKKLRNDMYSQCTMYGRQLLVRNPEIIAVDFFMKINNMRTILADYSIEKAENLREKIINIENHNDRWEYVKMYFNSVTFENVDQRNLLNSIGAVYFYKTPYEKRHDMYQRVIDVNYELYGGFFNGYFNNFEYLMRFVDSIKENIFYVNYLKTSLTQYEKAFIFYYITSNKSSTELRQLIKKYGLLNDLEFNADFFVDAPTITEFNRELESILNFNSSII
jgi:hypothetical protein